MEQFSAHFITKSQGETAPEGHNFRINFDIVRKPCWCCFARAFVVKTLDSRVVCLAAKKGDDDRPSNNRAKHSSLEKNKE